MPRVKLIYIGDGEYIEPVAKMGSCTHPRDKLRFDPRFGLPVSVYCMDCGQPYLNPFHGLTQDEIDEARVRAEKLLADLNWDAVDDDIEGEQ